MSSTGGAFIWNSDQASPNKSPTPLWLFPKFHCSKYYLERRRRLIKKEGARNRPPNAPAVFFFSGAPSFFFGLEGDFLSEPSFCPPFFSLEKKIQYFLLFCCFLVFFWEKNSAFFAPKPPFSCIFCCFLVSQWFIWGKGYCHGCHISKGRNSWATFNILGWNSKE